MSFILALVLLAHADDFPDEKAKSDAMHRALVEQVEIARAMQPLKLVRRFREKEYVNSPIQRFLRVGILP